MQQSVESKVPVNMRDNWRTPRFVFEHLQKALETEFLCDLAADIHNSHCDRYFSAEKSALSHDWPIGTSFCNPPFTRKVDFVRRAVEQQARGAFSVFVLPVDLVQKYTQEHIAKHATAVLVPACRISYIKPETGETATSAPFESYVVVFGGARPGNVDHVPFIWVPGLGYEP